MIQRANEASVIGTAPSSESLEGLLYDFVLDETVH